MHLTTSSSDSEQFAAKVLGGEVLPKDKRQKKRKSKNARKAIRLACEADRGKEKVAKMAQMGIEALEEQANETMAVVKKRDEVASDMACSALRQRSQHRSGDVRSRNRWRFWRPFVCWTHKGRNER